MIGQPCQIFLDDWPIMSANPRNARFSELAAFAGESKSEGRTGGMGDGLIWHLQRKRGQGAKSPIFLLHGWPIMSDFPT